MNEMSNIRYIPALLFCSVLGGCLFGFDIAFITGDLPFLVDQFGLGARGESATTASLSISAMVAVYM
jgi:hypothetical protein